MSSFAASSSGVVPSLLTAGISEDEAQTRATSSMTMQVASASAPTPSYCSGMCGAWKSAARSASYASCGNRLSSSTAAAYGATLSSHRSRTASRSASWSSERRYRSKSLMPGMLLAGGGPPRSRAALAEAPGHLVTVEPVARPVPVDDGPDLGDVGGDRAAARTHDPGAGVQGELGVRRHVVRRGRVPERAVDHLRDTAVRLGDDRHVGVRGPEVVDGDHDVGRSDPAVGADGGGGQAGPLPPGGELGGRQ